MKTLLVGNGINIQFGGKAYTNDFIMKRVKYRVKTGESLSLFNGTLQKHEILAVLNGFVDIANGIREKEYDALVHDQDTQDALDDFKERYRNKIDAPHEIMLEDWFFLLHIYFLKYPMDAGEAKNAKQGFESLILDAIYNSGKIQELYKKINKKTRRYFQGFDNVFTLNYDNTLDRLTGKAVYHLHGDFNELASSENVEYVLGYLRQERNEIVANPEFSQCYCNALLNYSGKLKKKVADANYLANKEAETFVDKWANDKEFQEQLECLRTSNSRLYELIKTKISHPELKWATDYYFEQLANIEGELHILGMSPNNDGHIFECINSNSKITKVVFYYYSEKEKKYIEDNLPHPLYQGEEVANLWKHLDCEKKSLNCDYKIDKRLSQLISQFNALSDDEVTIEQVLSDLKDITYSDMKRLCLMVKEDMEMRNPDLHPTDAKELSESLASISYIALQQGILPTTLYVIVVMNFKDIEK